MAIQLFCSACKTTSDLSAKKCAKCGTAFPKQGRKYRVFVKNKGKVATRVVDNLTIAREVEGALKGDLVRDEFDIADHRAQDKPLNLADVWEKYLPWAQSEKKKSWMTDDFFYRKHLEPRFGKKALGDIASLEIERMKSEMKKTKTPQGKVGYSDATVRHVLVLLGSLFKKARKWNLFDGKAPTDSVKKPKLDNMITEFLTDDEMRRLSETLDSWPCKQSADFVRICLFTGMRKSEVLKLTWDCVDLERKTFTIRDPKNGTTTTLPLSDRAVSVFENIDRASSFVLPGPDGQIKKTFRHPWYAIRKAAGLPETYRLHGLRHNFVSQLVSNGVDIYTASKLAGHKDLRTTEKRYAHLSDEALRRAANKSGELLTPRAGTKIIRLRDAE